MDTENYTHIKTFAGAPRTDRGRPTAINVHPLGTKFLYCNGNSVFIRDIEDPSDCDVYTQHAKETTCAAYSPSGYYICSGDKSGKIRIWDTINKEHILKYEYGVLGGAIKDIKWSEDSKRIAVCGEGKENYAKVINWDTGTTCGNLHGAGKACNNITFKQNRPYRIVVVSEDFSTYFFEGIPFKLNKPYHEHQNFANCARFSPDGAKFVTAGADGKCFVHDGKTGELLGELQEKVGKIHKGGVYGIDWSPDGKHLLTVSADKTAKIWLMDDANYLSNKEAMLFTLGNEIGDMQVGCAWSRTTLLSISLNGNINYLNANNSDTIDRIVKGHGKAIVASCLSADRSTLFTASFDGQVLYWNLQTGEGNLIEGTGHRSQVQSICRHGDNLITCGMDDTVRFISVEEKKYIEGKIVLLESQPQRLYAGKNNIAVVACSNALVLLDDDKIIQTLPIKYDLTCVAMSSCLGKVAVGTDHSKVLLFDVVNEQEGVVLKEADPPSTPANGKITDVKFSPDKTYLGMCTGNKQVKVVETADYKTERLSQASHAVKVNSLAWTPNSQYITSCGIDGAVFTYCVKDGADKGERVVTMRGAHAQSVDVTSVQWSSDHILITTGRQDCSIRLWKVLLE